ncbi:MAG: diguanylate cyclase [Sterolibacterium sp.]|nr:diguanylate cyclase [Sterolibacterium sp.]
MKNTTGLLHRFHSSIILRSAALVLLLSGIVGYGMMNVITRYVEPTVQESITKRLGDLVKTVENTARIACFLGDTHLAEEVAKGLLMSRDVERVVISNDQGVLADLDRKTLEKQLSSSTSTSTPPTAAAAPTPTISAKTKATINEHYPEGSTIRMLTSPFKAESNIGKIVVVRNQASIDAQIDEAMSFIRTLTILQSAVIILVVALIAVGYIAQPIHRISRQLNELSAVDGEKLITPAGHGKNEIGQLVSGINALVDRLVRGLMTERTLRMEREIEEKRFRAIFENAETGIFVIDSDAQLKSFNPAFNRALWLNEDDLQKIIAGLPVYLVDYVGEQAGHVRTLIEDCLKEHRAKSAELMLLGNNGGVRWVNMILNPVEDNLIQGVINDVTENKMREAQATKLALTDTLTGLGNRLGFERQIDTLIAERKINHDRIFTLMFIDLDHFKEVNDTLGHDAGDAILTHVARHIEHSIRKADFAARLGGDEFVVLLPFVADEKIVNRLATSLIANISKPVRTASGAEARVGASIGVALVDEPDLKREEIIKRADLALYAVKQAGRNSFRIYDAATMPPAST